MKKLIFLLLFAHISLAAQEAIIPKTLDLRSKKVLRKGVHPWMLKLGDSPIVSSDQLEGTQSFLYASRGYIPSDANGWVDNVKVPASLMNQVDSQGNQLIGKFAEFKENYSGYIWYRTEVDLSKDDVKKIFGNRNLVLRLGWIGQADAVYWNGEYIGSTGLQKDTPPNGELEDDFLYYDKHRFYDVPSDLLDYKNPNVIAVRVYAKHPIKPGLSMGKYYLSSREYADRAEYWDDFKKVFVITLTLLLGIFYLFWQFIFRKDEQATIYFALASIFMSLNTLTQSKVVYSVIESGVNIVKLEYISWIILFHLLLSFLVKFSRISGKGIKISLYLLHAFDFIIGGYLLFQTN
ncbi:MAG: adenylate/guanylate cyclase domain-containing protein, partial [Leptospira sp.]|nr:adenylate/guanylate cyclase domain-containing protein [Leptospira sp.]